MCAPLLTETIIYSVSECKLTWFLKCAVLVMEPVACLVSEGELVKFFNVCSSNDTECGPSCFSW